jgi:hypothetical protein
MTVLLIILGITACLFNFLMDEVKHKYDRFFGKILPDSWDKWFNPEESWQNKYFSKYPFVRFLFSTVLVWTTDFWHFAKFVTLTCFGLIVVILENDTLSWWKYGLEVLFLGLMWFMIWEGVNGIVGAISDKLKRNE